MSATVKITDRLGQLSGDPKRRDFVRRCFFMVTGGDADWDDAAHLHPRLLGGQIRARRAVEAAYRCSRAVDWA